MSLGDCKAPGGVARRFRWARRVDHGSGSLYGSGSWAVREVWSWLGEGSMGGIGARRRAAASVDVAGVGRRRGLGRPSEQRWAGGPRERRKGSDRAEPSLATVRAAVCVRPEHSKEEDFHGFCFVRCRGGGIEGSSAGNQVRGAVAIGEEAVMPDALKALGEHVQQKPTDKLLGG